MLLVLVSAIVCALAQPSPPPQKVAVPGYQGPPLDVSSGYLHVGKKRLFYLHIASLSNPATDPLMVWYQGGPGGSSMIGLFSEMGPFKVVSKDLLEFKSLNWQQFTNGIYIDQPACVGFSYSEDLQACENSSDTNAAETNHLALQELFSNAMPQYANRDFYITGESWAGMYGTSLGALVAEDPVMSKHFRGLSLGNPVIMCTPTADHDPQYFSVGNTYQQMSQLYWNGYVSQDLWEKFSAAGCIDEPQRSGKYDPTCFQLFTEAHSALPHDFDRDDNFGDFCTGNGTLALTQSVCDPSNPPSYDSIMNAYLEQDSVRDAFHANATFGYYSKYFNYDHNLDSTLPLLARIYKAKPDVKVLYYSGLGDILTVPFTFSMPCLNEFHRQQNSTVKTQWQAWYLNDHSAGSFQVWSSGFIYATVRGSGHEMPMYNPLPAYEMFKHFLNDSFESQLGQAPTIRQRLRPKPLHRMKQSELLEKFVLSKK